MGIKIYTYICSDENGLIMPTLFTIFGMRFFFYSDEHLPIHVHVENSDGRAKILVSPKVEVSVNQGIKPKDLKKAVALVKTCRADIIKRWNECQG